MKEKNLNRLAVLAIAAFIPKLFNDFAFNSAKPTPNPLNGEYKIFNWKNYNIFYTQAGEGSPVVLIHGIGSGASSYSFRKNFDHLSKSHTVYAVDLLGFGMSDPARIHYDAELYADLIYDFVRFIIREKTDVVASSLSSAYCIKAALKNSAYFNKLVFIAPTGIVNLEKPVEAPQEMIYNTVKSPYMGTSIYNFINCRRNIRSFLENNMFYDKDMVTDEMVEHYYNSSHIKGVASKYAIAAFLGGHLNANISKELRLLNNPMLVIWGKNSKLSPDDEAVAFEALNPNVKTVIYDNCGISPNEELHKEFNKEVSEFLKA